MKWKKKGLIFKPSEFELFKGLNNFAQSPQALVLNDRIRIYFSTREKDNNKYISHIQYVDFEKNMENIITTSKHEVIPLGELGCFDEHGIFPMNVTSWKSHIYAFTGGWSRRHSVSVETSIGIAISENDGTTFQKPNNGPILTSSKNEPCLVGDPFVLPRKSWEEHWQMFYIYGKGWLKSKENTNERIYKIGHAEGSSLTNWTKSNKQLIEDKLGPNECQAMPTVLKYQGKYHMYFCYREPFDFRANPNCSYKLGYAYSKDMKNWTRDDSLAGISVSNQGWDDEMMCYPHIFKNDNNIYILYNGNKFGKEGFGIAILEED